MGLEKDKVWNKTVIGALVALVLTLAASIFSISLPDDADDKITTIIVDKTGAYDDTKPKLEVIETEPLPQ